MTDTWQNEFGNIKVNDRGMRVAQRDGEEELLLEGQASPGLCLSYRPRAGSLVCGISARLKRIERYRRPDRRFDVTFAC